MKKYDVVAKCGHVRRSKYILKHFFVKADNGKAAAQRVRETPRVKHDQKYAIVSVRLISDEEYEAGLLNHKADLYFVCRNNYDQKKYCPDIYEEVVPEEKNIMYRKETHYRKRQTETLFIKECTGMMEFIYE